ncbi:uncharacterized protein G2W53_043616 [Senna tora]|uniref:Uncharacterized protein n=1 Tax=Senna tora TaxID=362788 RepID=A0A834SHC1_9FABA|nr:uncharacterized protein G2W53_043616 [Senna tora]
MEVWNVREVTCRNQIFPRWNIFSDVALVMWTKSKAGSSKAVTASLKIWIGTRGAIWAGN